MDEIAITANIASEAVDFSMLSLFLRADFVVKSVIIILIMASIYSWSIIVGKIISLNEYHSDLLAETRLYKKQVTPTN